jgi:hypothetical protein
MSAMLLLFVQNPQIALMTPQGLRHGYEPFWASHWWLADSGHKSRCITADEYAARVLRSDDEALKLRCGERGMDPCATREETIAALLACLDVPAPDHLDVATWSELVQECRLLNLNAAGSEADLRARIRDSKPAAASEPALPPAPIEELGAEVTNEIAPDPIPLASVALPEVDCKVLADLKVALDANDYNTVWSLATNLTETRPASKAKPEMFSWARGVVASLEG